MYLIRERKDTHLFYGNRYIHYFRWLQDIKWSEWGVNLASTTLGPLQNGHKVAATLRPFFRSSDGHFMTALKITVFGFIAANLCPAAFSINEMRSRPHLSLIYFIIFFSKALDLFRQCRLLAVCRSDTAYFYKHGVIAHVITSNSCEIL